MTAEQREIKIEALVDDLKAFGDSELSMLLSFVEGMKAGITKRKVLKG